MNIDEQLFDRIEDYLKGKLSATESKLFEKEIAENKDLAELVEMQRFEQEGMEYLVEKDLRQKMESWESPNPTPPPNKRSMLVNWKLFLGVAVLLSLIAFGILKMPGNTKEQDSQTQPKAEIKKDNLKQEPVRKPNNPPEDEVKSPPREIASKPTLPSSNNPSDSSKTKPENQKNYLALAQSNYQMPENLNDISLRGDDPKAEKSPLNQGLQFFDDKNWDAAITEFSKIDESKNPDEFDVAQEYLAHAYFNTKSYKSAASIFQSILNQDFIMGQEETEWYLLLSWLPDYTKNKKAINSLVTKILNQKPPHEYLEKVSDLQI